MKAIQDSTFDLLKNISQELYDEYSIQVILNTISLLKKRKHKRILFFFNSENEPNIFEVLTYCLSHHYECYVVSFYNKQLAIKKIVNLNFSFRYYLYTKIPIINDNQNYNHLDFDVILVPLLNFDNNKNYIDTTYDLVHHVLSKVSHLETWGYSFSFQKYQNLNKHSKGKIDFIITNRYIL